MRKILFISTVLLTLTSCAELDRLNQIANRVNNLTGYKTYTKDMFNVNFRYGQGSNPILTIESNIDNVVIKDISVKDDKGICNINKAPIADYISYHKVMNELNKKRHKYLRVSYDYDKLSEIDRQINTLKNSKMGNVQVWLPVTMVRYNNLNYDNDTAIEQGISKGLTIYGIGKCGPDSVSVAIATDNGVFNYDFNF